MERLVIEDIRPRIKDGAYPAKAIAGRPILVAADIFRDGTAVLTAVVRWKKAAGGSSESFPMEALPNHRWQARVDPSSIGLYEFVIEAWSDHYATWKRDVDVKFEAGQSIEVELEEGARLLEASASLIEDERASVLTDAASAMRNQDLTPKERLDHSLGSEVEQLLSTYPPRNDLTRSRPMRIRIERPRAGQGAWYELFPRSYGGLEGTLKRLPAVADMGFDVLYLPPIHPIGVTDRKGRNNTIPAGPDDPGSPWAIGSEQGGHTAIDPDLGTIEDFDRLVEEVKGLGMEVALDYALQCSPDHPWVKEHPEWFHHRPDGTIKFAENPPKKYQDIYPINFWPETNREGLWEACKEILDFWISHGVRIFRVDNPHTKPLAFWIWVLGAVFDEHPDVVFLAEAFTHPKMMAKLAEIGYSQSYTYFTWRVTKQDLTDYLTELAQGPLGEYMRPNFWPNTPDILSGPLRYGGPGVFKMRLALAATMSPAYGIYGGYELCENEPARDTDEEYLNSEKYEIKDRNWDSEGSIAPYITRVNAIRRGHPSLLELRNIIFHDSGNPNVIAYSKGHIHSGDLVVVAVNLNPAGVEEARLWIDRWPIGVNLEGPVRVREELTGETSEWMHPGPVLSLEPEEPARIFHLTQWEAG
ncbi:MAG TPA: alpha-1,4-glucan--maltose-1-phosphate maltosyltransferase [Actinomycetota bacterium]|nr:alpha-1,4-glucan--maltose-1-phosphate maltosyltransferase [Actinomycetota bacterium]